MDLPAIWVSIVAGLLIGVPTGPARFMAVDVCVKEGKSAALTVYGGLQVSKLLYAALALLANDYLSTHKKIEAIIYLVAAALIMVWGVVIMITSKNEGENSIPLKIKSKFKKGFIVGMSNPAIPFIYLTLFQFLKLYMENDTITNYIINLAIFEIASFVALAVVALLLLSGKTKVLNHWNKVKIAMGMFLFCIGAFQVYQHLDFNNGLHIKSTQNPLEKQLKKAGESGMKRAPKKI